MSSETTVALTSKSGGAMRRLSVLVAALFWATGAACASATLCYAYHIGI
jgi:hypothetical protein